MTKKSSKEAADHAEICLIHSSMTQFKDLYPEYVWTELKEKVTFLKLSQRFKRFFIKSSPTLNDFIELIYYSTNARHCQIFKICKRITRKNLSTGGLGLSYDGVTKQLKCPIIHITKWGWEISPGHLLDGNFIY